MTIIIKSDQVASNYISNKYGIDNSDFAIMLDFNRQDYLKIDTEANAVPLQLNDIINCVRDTAANYRTVDGVWNRVERDLPRISYDAKTNVGGLLIERLTHNYATNPESPVSQRLDLPASNDGLGIAISVYGTGSVKVTGTLNDVGEGRIATKDNPILSTLLKNSAGEVFLDIEVIGDLTYLQVEKIAALTSAFSATSKTVPRATGITLNGRSADVVSIKSSLAPEIASAKTILLNYQLSYTEATARYTSGYARKLLDIYDTRGALEGGSTASLTITYNTLNYLTGLRRVSLSLTSEGGTSTIIGQMHVPDTRNITIAISHDGKFGGLVYAINGTSSQTSSVALVNVLNGVRFGGAAGSASVDGMLTKLVAYDSHMSKEELESMTKTIS